MCIDYLLPFDAVAFPTILPFEELIDLGKLVSLKRFSITFTDHNETNYIPWLNRITSSASSNRQLEEICLKVLCIGGSHNDTWWYGAFDGLLQGKFKSLKRLKIFLSLEFMCDAPAYGKDLYNHEDIEKLRSQRGVAVDIIGKRPIYSNSLDYFNCFQRALILI